MKNQGKVYIVKKVISKMTSNLVAVIQDDGVRLLRPALEAVQFAGYDWRTASNFQLTGGGYAGIQLSSFHLPPKALLETDLAEQVLGFMNDLGPAYDDRPLELAGYSTHCALEAWGFQHPGSLLFVPAHDTVKETLWKA